jgi:hypothetical protein
MKTHLSDPSQRAYVSALVVMLRPDARPQDDLKDARRTVAIYLRAHREDQLEADLVLVGDSFSDPMPIHCFVQAHSGIRLADSNRCCKIRGQIYEWPNRQGVTVRGVVLARISTKHLLGDFVLLAALAEKARRRSDRK